MFRCLSLRRPRAREPQEAASPAPNPDHAWKVLSLVNEWIRHSDAKAGVTLAFTGVLGSTLFGIVKDFDQRSILFDVLVSMAVFLLVLSASFCAWTLTPRVEDFDAEPKAVNRLFFGSITSNFKGTRRQYRDALAILTTNPHELIKDLADQIHANSKIATAKATAVKRAIRSALAAGTTVAAIATVIGITN